MNPSRSSTMAAIASLSVSAAILVMTTMNGALAEEQNTIQVRGGETIEIATDAGSPEAEFSWILTRDRKFLSGQRTRFFQTRLTDPGTYTLDVSVQNPKTGENALRTFTLIVTEPAPDALPDTTDRTGMPLRSMVSTEPATLNGIVYLPPNGGILKIDASKSEGKIETYSIDLDTNTDSDSDGNPTNDRDNIGTLSEKSGSAVYFFALPKPAPRAVRVTVTDLSGAGPSSVDLPLSFTSSPTIPSSSVGVIQNVNGPIAVEQKDLDVTLAVNLNDPNLQGKQLLYEWDFGDRSRSLLDKPTHTYALAGTYVVTLTIRDISTAQVLQSISTTVQVAEPVLSSSSATQSESSASSSSASSSGSGSTSSFSLWSVIKVLFIIILLLGIAIGLYVLLTWIKKRTTSSIQQTLEKMEETIVKKDPKETAPEAAAPMNLKKDVVDVSVKKAPEDVAEREKSRPDFQVQKRPNETPLTSAGPVPPWLKNSSAPAEKATSTPVAAPTSAPAPSPAPKPAPAPAPAPKPTAAPAPTPAPATTAKAAPAPITAPVTTPKATPAPTATTSPAPKPPASVPAPAAKAAPVAGTNPSTAPVAAPAAKPPVQPSGTAPKATPVVTQAAPSAPKPSAAPAAVKPPAAEKPKQVTNPTPNPKVSPVPSVAQEEVPKPNVVSKPIPKVESKPIEKDDSDPPIAIIQADSIST